MKPIIPTRELRLGDEVAEKQDETKAPEPVILSSSDLPKYLYNANLKDISGYRDLRRDIKIKEMQDEFIKETKKIMCLFESDTKKYDHKLVLYLCQLCEHHFISHKKMGKTKKLCVVEVLKKFYNDDEELISSIIELVLPQIKKSTLVSRMQSRTVKFFYIIVSLFLKK